jgi:cell filamentation protein
MIHRDRSLDVSRTAAILRPQRRQSTLAQRAGFSIDWSQASKDDDLRVLSQELDRPGKGILDAYLKPFIRDPIAYEKLAESIALAPGIGGSDVTTNEVLGEANEPSVKARYKAVLAKRKRAENE